MIHAVNNPLPTHRPNAAPPAQPTAAAPTTPNRIAAQDNLALSADALRYAADEGVDAKVAEIRKLIANDEYLSDEKLDVVVNKLHKALYGDTPGTPLSLRKMA